MQFFYYMEHIQFLFEHINDDKKELLIAMLSDIDFHGFEEEKDKLKAFIQSEKFDEKLFNFIIDIINTKYSKSIIEEENWNKKWEADFEPVMVHYPKTKEPFVFIRANFHQPNPTFLYNISVMPKMSFGTGHHATTQLMVAYMSEINFIGKSVIDFGTGTGVLAIIAEKLGAIKIVGIDNDEWSINNAKENLLENNCTKTELVKAETISQHYKAQLILANINLNIIKENIAAIIHAAETDSIFLFSGIMLHDKERIKRILIDAGLQIKLIDIKDGWLIIKAIN